MESNKLCICQGAGCTNCGDETHSGSDAALNHPAGVMAVVAVAGSIGILYGMVAMLFVEAFAA
ncbi:MAG: hypothetical protein KC925_03000 [Candidatus Doudnabacteria bacterium]|nr:hypothetical protein [Candidatus Doudnabacteria bacterium]